MEFLKSSLELSNGWLWALVGMGITALLTIWATRRGVIEGFYLGHIQNKFDDAKKEYDLYSWVSANLTAGQEWFVSNGKNEMDATEMRKCLGFTCYQKANEYAQTHKEQFTPVDLYVFINWDKIEAWLQQREEFKMLVDVNELVNGMKPAKEHFETERIKFARKVKALRRGKRRFTRRFFRLW